MLINSRGALLGSASLNINVRLMTWLILLSVKVKSQGYSF